MSEKMKDRLKEAEASYDLGEPTMTDQQYDAITSSLGVEQAIGGASIERKVQHQTPMLSLEKSNTDDQLTRWLNKLPAHSTISVEYKYDGLALSVIYENGLLEKVVTRGNGMVGEDLSFNSAKSISNIPNTIDQKGRIEIRGEAYIEGVALESINQRFDFTYGNVRNAVAGALRRHDSIGLDIASDYIKFVAYENPSNAQGLDGIEIQVSKMDAFIRGGVDESWVKEKIQEIEDSRSGLPFDIDGAVIKVLDNDIREDMGATSHHPKWAMAWKYEEALLPTTIREVIWNKGRTGKITPVALFDTIDLGTNVSQATLHNAGIFRSFDLHVGDIVFVKKAHDVIPKIVSSLSGEEDRGKKFEQPTECPDCGSELEVLDIEIVCNNEDCGIFGKILHSLVTLGVKGVSGSLISKLLNADEELSKASTVTQAIERIINLQAEDIEFLEGFAQLSAEKAVASLEVIKTYDLGSWISAMGISGVGSSVSRNLALEYGSLQAIIDESVEDILSRQIPLVGYLTAEKLTAKKGVLLELKAMMERQGIEEWVYDPTQGASDADESNMFFGKNVVVTGTIDGISRNEASSWLTAQGATIQGSVSKTTDYLIAGEKAGSKLSKAQSLGVEIIEGNSFLSHYNS